MKKIYYLIFKRDIYNVYKELNRKKIDRLQRLIDIKKELGKWSDIPVSWQLPGICDKLRIKNNEAAYNFVMELLLDVDINVLAKKLPLK